LVALVVGAAIFSPLPRISFWAALFLLSCITFFYLAGGAISTPSQIRQLIYLIISVSVFLSVFGLLKKTGHNPFGWWDYDPSGLNRTLALSTSTFGNPNHFGGYLEMAIPLTLGLAFTGLNKPQRMFMILFAGILMSALILSLSRGGWISTFVGLLFMGSVSIGKRLISFDRRWILSFGGLLFCLAIVFLSSRANVEEARSVTAMQADASLLSRLSVWKSSLAMIKDHPLLGTGPGTFSSFFTQYQPPSFHTRFYRAHNQYLQFVSEAGIFIIPIILWLVSQFYINGFEKMNHPSRLVRGTTLGAMSGVTAALFHSMFDFTLKIPANALLFVILVAIVVMPAPKIARPVKKRVSRRRNSTAV
jgi:O-antigen ligase